jgi:hypothetical protein
MGYPTAILLVFPGGFDVFSRGCCTDSCGNGSRVLDTGCLVLVALRVFEAHTKIIFLEAFLGVLISSEVFFGWIFVLQSLIPLDPCWR